jgi:hypothetical protein
MAHNSEEEQKLVDETVESYKIHGNNLRTALALGVSRSTVRRRLEKAGVKGKPLAGGTRYGTKTKKMPLPKGTDIKRYILTSAQNNTHVNEDLLDNLEALAKHYSAEIIVGTYTYNQNAYGKLAVKRGTKRATQHELWYDPEIEPYIKDYRIQLAPGLVWAGEYNALPTNVRPLAGLEAYTGRNSSIFPHAKLAMRSIPTMQDEGVKLNFTTGTVTERNYIQKREGIIAEFHHIYGALLVEVDSKGNWWVRQLNQDEGTNTLQDLDVLVQDGEVVRTDATVESVTHGDLHGVFVDPVVKQTTLEMVDLLKPKFQFFHDIMEGVAVNPHMRKYQANHEKFHTWLRGYHKLENELVDTAAILAEYERDFSQTVIVDSNHDDAWMKKWLREYDYRKDPPNTEIFLDLQAYLYGKIRNGVTDEESRLRIAKPKFVRDVNVLEYALKKYGKYKAKAKFLKADQSFLTCGRKIENGMHGHLGPAGRFGTPENLSQMARKANTAHTHSAGIWNGLYVAGTSAQKRWDYAKGPSGQTHSHTLTYPNGKRAIVTIYKGKWRA